MLKALYLPHHVCIRVSSLSGSHLLRNTLLFNLLLSINKLVFGFTLKDSLVFFIKLALFSVLIFFHGLQVNSIITGPILIEDVIYEDESLGIPNSEGHIIFRRLIFERSPGLVQSEALLTKECKLDDNFDETNRKESLSPKSGKKRSQNKSASCK